MIALQVCYLHHRHHCMAHTLPPCALPQSLCPCMLLPAYRFDYTFILLTLFLGFLVTRAAIFSPPDLRQLSLDGLQLHIKSCPCLCLWPANRNTTLTLNIINLTLVGKQIMRKTPPPLPGSGLGQPLFPRPATLSSLHAAANISVIFAHLVASTSWFLPFLAYNFSTHFFLHLHHLDNSETERTAGERWDRPCKRWDWASNTL